MQESTRDEAMSEERSETASVEVAPGHPVEPPVGPEAAPIHPAELAVGSAIRLFEFAPVPYLVLSESGEIRAASRLAGQIFGADPNALARTNLAERLAAPSRATLAAHLRSVIGAKLRGRCDLRIETGDGRLLWVRLVSRPLPPSREWGEGVLAVACEIDDLIRAQEIAAPHEAIRTAVPVDWDPSYGAVPSGHAPEQSTRTEPGRPGARAGAGGPRVLIVDDEKLILSSTARMLRRMGYETEGAAGAEEALALFERDPGCFELVITDYRMPGLSGLQLAERLHARRPDLPIVLVSGFTEEIDAESAVQAGVREMFSKPLTATEFEACLDRITEDGLERDIASSSSS